MMKQFWVTTWTLIVLTVLLFTHTVITDKAPSLLMAIGIVIVSFALVLLFIYLEKVTRWE